MWPFSQKVRTATEELLETIKNSVEEDLPGWAYSKSSNSENEYFRYGAGQLWLGANPESIKGVLWVEFQKGSHQKIELTSKQILFLKQLVEELKATYALREIWKSQNLPK